MKITYYSKYSDLGPSSRYRAYQFLDLFRSAGFDFNISPLFDRGYFDILRTNPSLREAKKIPYTLSRFRKRKQDLKDDTSQLAVIEQQLFPYLPFLLEKKYLPKRYLLEFDDAIYLTHPRKMPDLVRNAAGIIAGNETLAEFARRFNDHVHVVPTVLNTDVFKPVSKVSKNRLILGWSGLEYNFQYLRILSSVLQKIVAKFAVQVLVLSGSPPQGLEFPYRFEKWNPDTEVHQLNQFDIGLMPLKFDDWCRGKCGFKLLQYMALEIPSVATPVGVNQQIVNNGSNGFLAKDSAEWESCLAELISNPALRDKMGKAARSTVLENYSTAFWFPKIVALYRSYQ